MIIEIANLKGGCGKTTTAIALATAASVKSYETIVLDVDPQASATLWADNAENIGNPLPFNVMGSNYVSVKRDAKKYRGECEKWAFVDCPPSGDIIDKISDISDFIIIPTGTGTADLSKTYMVAKTLSDSGKKYAVLITQARAKTLSLADTITELREKGIVFFKTVIPLREDLKLFYGNNFDGDLFNYDELFSELQEMVVA